MLSYFLQEQAVSNIAQSGRVAVGRLGLKQHFGKGPYLEAAGSLCCWRRRFQSAILWPPAQNQRANPVAVLDFRERQAARVKTLRRWLLRLISSFAEAESRLGRP